MNPGTTISHYRVVGQLGRGGMGVVYKADDTKLDRTVALKLLPPHALISEDDRARFYREARAAAALNHPNIAHVYEIDEAMAEGESRPFIAMEYIDGESLAERIEKGPLPLAEAITIASALANGLKAAHDKEIVHRDMKAGNVMLTSAGVPKILDFGLAKTSASTKLTQMGSTLGTVAYMSPEQARGEEVDRRSDIWSLGAIIYEMVTGRMPFAGDYEQAVVYGILNQDPEPLTSLRTGVPMELERIVNKCLSKERKLRYQHVDDLASDLLAMETPAASRISVAPRSSVTAGQFVVATTPKPSHIRSVAAGILLLLTGVVIGWLVFQMTSPQSAVTPLHVTIAASDEAGWRNYEPGSRQMSLSHDGTRLVYIGSLKSGMETLFVVDFTSPDPPRQLSHVELASVSDPVFSPDGESVAFGSFDGIRLVSIRGGSVKTVAEAIATPPGVSWTQADYVVYSPSTSDGLYRVSILGGDPVALTTPDSSLGETGHVRGLMLPDGKTVACVILGEHQRLALIDTETGDRYTVSTEGMYPQFVEPDVLLYAEGNSLFAVTVDLSNYTLGSPRLVLDDIAGRESWGTSQYTVSGEGSLAYLTGGKTLDRRLIHIDLDGNLEYLSDRGRGIDFLTPSPSGTQVALVLSDARGSTGLGLLDVATGDVQNLTLGDGNQGFPLWGPDGRTLYFSSDRSGRVNLYKMRPGDASQPDLLLESEFDESATGVSSDGKYLAFLRDTRSSNGLDIWILPLDQSRPAYPIVQGPSEELWPAISPDGRLVAYTSDESGRMEVYAVPFSGGRNRVKISRTGETGGKLVWSTDGRYLYFVSDGKLMRSTVLDGGLRFTDPVSVLESDELRGRWIRGNWDLDPNGEGIITLTRLEPSELRLIVNWKTELEERMSGE
jgi:serine/threonine-protein kinase